MSREYPKKITTSQKETKVNHHYGHKRTNKMTPKNAVKFKYPSIFERMIMNDQKTGKGIPTGVFLSTSRFSYRLEEEYFNISSP